jgi:hypothetical protein
MLRLLEVSFGGRPFIFPDIFPLLCLLCFSVFSATKTHRSKEIFSSSLSWLQT